MFEDHTVVDPRSRTTIGGEGVPYATHRSSLMKAQIQPRPLDIKRPPRSLPSWKIAPPDVLYLYRHLQKKNNQPPGPRERLSSPPRSDCLQSRGRGWVGGPLIDLVADRPAPKHIGSGALDKFSDEIGSIDCCEPPHGSAATSGTGLLGTPWRAWLVGAWQHSPINRRMAMCGSAKTRRRRGRPRARRFFPWAHANGATSARREEEEKKSPAGYRLEL